MPKSGKFDPKGNFYRGLNLDKDTRDILKWYKGTHKQLMNDEIDEDVADEKD